MKEKDKEFEQKVGQLQLIQQNLQNFSLQKQQLQMQVNQIDSALKELGGAEEGYRIMGEIMVKSKKGDLEKHLKERKESIELMIKNYEKQEEKLRERAKELQGEVVKGLKSGEKNE